MHRFTAEFGMESGGSNALCSSSNSFGNRACRHSLLIQTHDKKRYNPTYYKQSGNLQFANFRLIHSSPQTLWCYMVKPHGQLVLVSSTPHNAYTPSLSTL